MGAEQSTGNSAKDNQLLEKLNGIAANYILTQNFKDMKELNDTKYCDKLILLTSKILDDTLTSQQLGNISQKLNIDGQNKDKGDMTVKYLRKNKLPNLNIKDKEQRKVICNSLAKYYIKAAHIFSSIVTTIDPTWSIKDGSGNKQIINLNEKINVTPGSQINLQNINLCSDRLARLKNNSNLGDDGGQKIKVMPNVCRMNLDNSDFNRPVTSQQIYSDTPDYRVVNTGFGEKYLADEPGIPELEKLYYDVFDSSTGKYNSMSDKMRKAYNKDLKAFYTAFTGDEPTGAITSFKDIRLKKYHKNPVCQPKDYNSTNPSQGAFLMSYSGSKSEKYFKQYAEHIRKMMQTTNDNRDKLLAILDKLFKEEKEKGEQGKFILNPELNDTSMNELAKKTRDIIVKLYITCQTDFLKALDIFEKIIASQTLRINSKKEQELQEYLAENNIGTNTPQGQL